MWLVTQNRILTKDNLRHRGWLENTQCHFCTEEESGTHLFLLCPLIQQVWYWMGISQYIYKQWHTFQDIINFACSLKGKQQKAFLIVFSALTWTIWKIRNDICFQQKNHKTFKTIILLIISLVAYWLGNVPQLIQDLVPLWLPANMEEIPLQVWYPTESDLQMVLYQGPPPDMDGSATC